MPQANLPNIQIPGYRIIESLGKGGMATVYLAIQESINRTVALKLLKPALLSDPSFGKRFLREARIAGQLSHPNIVQVFDVGTAGEHYYLTMEYCQKGDLKARMAAGITVQEALEITKMLAEALAFAHTKGFIHRDIKSDNVMFRDDGTVVLADFGIARPTESMTRMTVTGSIIGTPSYMSPEQAKGEKLDGRSDLYSLGVVLFELISGHLPYKGDSTFSVGLKHINDPIPLLPRQISSLQEMIDRAMAKDPNQRFQSGHELAQAIAGFIEQQSGIDGQNSVLTINVNQLEETPRSRTDTQIQTPSSKRNRNLAVVLGTAVLASAVGLGVFFRQEDNGTSIEDNLMVETPAAVSTQVTLPIKEVNPVEERIDLLLTKAQGYTATDQILTASGKDAYGTYKEIFSLDPSHEAAIENINAIRQRHFSAISEDINQQRWQQAEDKLNLLESLEPELPRLVALKQTLTSTKTQFENQQREKARLAQEQKSREAAIKKQKAERRDRIEQLKTSIDTHLNPLTLSENKLVAAYNELEKLKQLDSNSPQLASYLQRIADGFNLLASQEFRASNLNQADKLVTQGLSLFSDHEKLYQLQGQISNRREELKQIELSQQQEKEEPEKKPKRNLNFGGF